jgi:hypothetical protein
MTQCAKADFFAATRYVARRTDNKCKTYPVSILLAESRRAAGKSKVGIIVIRCPKTDQEISTGIEIEPEDFLLLPQVAGRVQCPLCREEHSWLPSTARVKDVELRDIDQTKPGGPSPADAS